MFDIGAPELIIVLAIILLLFGVGRIGKIAGELGNGIREFRNSLAGKDDDAPASELTPRTDPVNMGLVR